MEAKTQGSEMQKEELAREFKSMVGERWDSIIRKPNVQLATQGDYVWGLGLVTALVEKGLERSQWEPLHQALMNSQNQVTIMEELGFDKEIRAVRNIEYGTKAKRAVAETFEALLGSIWERDRQIPVALISKIIPLFKEKATESIKTDPLQDLAKLVPKSRFEMRREENGVRAVILDKDGKVLAQGDIAEKRIDRLRSAVNTLKSKLTKD